LERPFEAWADPRFNPHCQLERPFEDEVFEMVKALDGDKARSPNGFTMYFFQVCWEVLKEDITNVCNKCHARGMFVKSFNVTFISLISKKLEAVDIKEF
jgi:hypothetical protein